MRSPRVAFVTALAAAIAAALVLWRPLHADAANGPPGPASTAAANAGVPQFRVDPSWPEALPSTTDANGVAHRWVAGEIAATCIDANDNVVTFNRGWQKGVTYTPPPGSGAPAVTQGAESGALVGQDSTASAIPAPPVVIYDGDTGAVRAAWGDPALIPTGGPDPSDPTKAANPFFGAAAVMPHGAHGCFVDFEGNVWLGGNGDGIVQKYSEAGELLLQIGQKGQCDGPANNTAPSGANVFPTCGEAHDFNDSHTKLNEPADIAVDPDVGPISGKPGDVYIADGYGNHRVVVFDRDGNWVTQFGRSCGHNGADCPDGTFGATGGGHPHCVTLGNDGLVYACDRPNSRIEVFRKDGTFVRKIVVEPPAPAVPAQAAILKAGTRACDMDFWPNVDYLASFSPTSQRLIVDVDLGNDNTWILDKATGTMLGAVGRCGLAPCPGHNAGEFAYGHTAATDSHGNVFVAETITGRRIQKFVRVGGGR